MGRMAIPWRRAHALGVLLAALAALWLATRPYSGVAGDGWLYALSAENLAWPGRFAGDLFLQFGSQDRFTIFSFIYAPALAWLGLTGATLLLTVAGQALWLGGAYWLALALVRRPVPALLAVAGLVALPAYYGAQFILPYGESTLTPRLFAEAFSMFALGDLQSGRGVRAAALLAVAAAFHPIMALPGIAVLVLHKGTRAWWLVAACAAAVAGVLAAAGVEPFARLGLQVDPAWLEIIERRSSYSLMLRWAPLDFSVLVSQLALAVLAVVALGPDVRRLIVAVLVVALGGLVVSLLGVDLARNQLLASVQPWRATWLLAVMANLLAVPVLMSFVRPGSAVRPLAKVFTGAGVLLLGVATLLNLAFIWAALVLAMAAILAPLRGDGGKLPLPIRWWGVVAAAGIAASLVYFGFEVKAQFAAWPEHLQRETLEFLFRTGGIALAVSVPFIWGSARLRPAAAWAATALAACLLLASVLAWDHRSAWTRFVQATGPAPAELAAFLPRNATVYWDGGIEMLWFRLQRPSFYSCAQGAGIMFFRDTAMAFARRQDSLRFAILPARRCQGREEPGPLPPDRAELQRACAREPALDVIVLGTEVPGVPRRAWVPPVKLRDVRWEDHRYVAFDVGRFYAYACADLR